MIAKATFARPAAKAAPATAPEAFAPLEPPSLNDLGVPRGAIESLVMKFLMQTGTASGREICDQIRLPFGLAAELLRHMKADQLVAHRRSCGVQDFEYELTVGGMERARRLLDQSSYFGAAPVSLDEYNRAVLAQSPVHDRPTADGLRRALGDLSICPAIFSRLGQAMASVGAMFLYGAPGNGKTSIAERLTRAFGPHVWIPRSIFVEGEIVRVFDPMVHEPVATPPDGAGRIDQRWVSIRRPTIVVGGELTLDSLEMRANPATGCVEAPIHMKSNCGTLVIDDFGRQRMSTRELLNRWIVPLEKRYDYINTPTGRKVQVPFEQMIVFATNLDPSELVDEAFLRRIPYKIEVSDPSEDEFRELFRLTATKTGIAPSDEVLSDLIDEWYRPSHRPFRYCQPRDLLRQVHDYCSFHNEPPALTHKAVNAAATNYFAVMSASLMAASGHSDRRG